MYAVTLEGSEALPAIGGSKPMNHDHQHCIDSCTECAAVCRSTAEEARGMSGMEECARICDATADECERTLQTMRNGSNANCENSAAACERCAAECEKFDEPFMRKCAESCRSCAEACHAAAKTPVGAM
jgi:hypothetical protein